MPMKIGCMMVIRLPVLFWGSRFSPPERLPGVQSGHGPPETVIMLCLN